MFNNSRNEIRIKKFRVIQTYAGMLRFESTMTIAFTFISLIPTEPAWCRTKDSDECWNGGSNNSYNYIIVSVLDLTTTVSCSKKSTTTMINMWTEEKENVASFTKKRISNFNFHVMLAFIPSFVFITYPLWLQQRAVIMNKCCEFRGGEFLPFQRCKNVAQLFYFTQCRKFAAAE